MNLPTLVHINDLLEPHMPACPDCNGTLKMESHDEMHYCCQHCEYKVPVLISEESN